MILFCDEDVGTSIPRALNLVGCEAKYIHGLGWDGKPDTYWLTEVGRNGWLAFSYNKKILKVPSEKAAIINERVGIIFLTSGQEYLRNVLRLLLTKWEYFESLWNTEKRPFARFLTPRGRITSRYKDYYL